MIKNEIKEVDLFTQEYLKLLYNCYLKKREASEKAAILKFDNIFVRVYIYRCLNLAAQDNCNSNIEFLAGYSSYCKANAYIEIMLGDNYTK